MDADEALALSERILSRPPQALDLSALDALPERWPSLPRASRIAIRRALLEARELVACAASHLGAP
jgi:hypothetical protein